MKRKRQDGEDAARMPPPSRPDNFPPPSAYGETVQIKVGKGRNAKTFTVHKEVLTFYSGYFEAAFPNGTVFQEAKTRVCTLADEEVAIFEKFVYWIYSRKIEYGSDDNAFAVLCRLWVLADGRQVPLLMNECVNTVRDKVGELWTAPTRSLSYIYKNTMPDSAMRRLIVQLIARTGGPSLLEDENPDNCKEMLVDILKVVWDLDASKKWTKRDVQNMRLCPEYHVHEDGIKCET
ncbi:hypothetical protein BST61_g7833 [Cercospora zeina]